ncbi:MAG: hypothetical protein ACE14Q_05865 [Acidobacteriota bacterium]|nr:hypothetical protein [Thermoanaerobaculaceae bacterium]
MRKWFFFTIALIIFSVSTFSQSINEVEPNGCISLVDGNDQYQTLYPGTTLFGSVSTSDTEGCLYFEYSDGDEYIEDLYAVEIPSDGYYSLSLFFSGNIDLDFFLMDEDLNVLNPDDCGSYNCGVTCGVPEMMNIYLSQGRYILGISVPTVYYCFETFSSNYVFSISNSSAPLQRPYVTSLAKASNPFRLLAFGKNLSNVTKVYISGSEWINFKLSGDELIKVKGGNSLKSKFPKDGSWVPITFVNSSNQSTTILYNRLYNMWHEGGF